MWIQILFGVFVMLYVEELHYHSSIYFNLRSLTFSPFLAFFFISATRKGFTDEDGNGNSPLSFWAVLFVNEYFSLERNKVLILGSNLGEDQEHLLRYIHYQVEFATRVSSFLVTKASLIFFSFWQEKTLIFVLQLDERRLGVVDYLILWFVDLLLV